MALDFVEGPQEDQWGGVPAAFASIVKTAIPQDTEAQSVTEPVEIITVAHEQSDPPVTIKAAPEETFRPEFASEPPPPIDNMAALVQLFTPLLTQRQSTSFSQKLTLEQSALNIMTLIDERFQTILHEQATNTSTSLAEVIAGILMLAGDRGNLGEFALNPEWRAFIHQTEGATNASGLPTQTMQAKCGHCQQMFKSPRSGQRYCCSPCGKRASGYREPGADHDSECPTPAAQFHQRMMAKAPQPNTQAS